MSLKIKIREAIKEDLSAVARLNGELGYETSSSEVRPRLTSIFEDQSHTVFVAAGPDNNVLGWIHVYCTLRLMSDPSAELGGFVVTERFQNQGIGKRLLAKAEDWAKDQGSELFIIRTRSTRKEAHLFYENAEYEFWKDHKVYRKRL